METTELQKNGLARILKNDIRLFLSNIDVEFRKQLLIAIDKEFGKATRGGKIISDYETNYYDKYKEIMQFISKAFVGNYAKELWEVCEAPPHTTIGGFIINELKESLFISDLIKNNDRINNDDGGE